MLWPPGHFYSPIPSITSVRANETSIFAVPENLPGIDLQMAQQVRLIEEFEDVAREQPFSADPAPGLRDHYDNSYFSYGDGLLLYCMLRHHRPARIVEVGSGYSSALMLDVNDRFLDGATRCTFIDPYPERLRTLLRPDEETEVHVLPVAMQDVELDVFLELRGGDVLFIDSSHVAKVGSDVNRLFFDVLPALERGVLVHIHDILYPFNYPTQWVYEGRAWNEAYLLRAFLTFNPAYAIRLFSSYLAAFHYATVNARLPLWGKNTGGSIWLERL